MHRHLSPLTTIILPPYKPKILIMLSFLIIFSFYPTQQKNSGTEDIFIIEALESISQTMFQISSYHLAVLLPC